jgi:hypothetical protein
VFALVRALTYAAWVRSPMCIGAWLALVGAALYFESAALLLFAVGFAAAGVAFVRFYEEPTLGRLFGAEYDRYRDEVGRWVPIGGAGHPLPGERRIVMRTRNLGWVPLAAFVLAQSLSAQGQWPTKGWPATTPSAVGLDPKALAALDADIAAGTYGYIDSMLVIRHGKVAYDRS